MAENFTKIIEVQFKSSDLISKLAEFQEMQQGIIKSQAELDQQFKKGELAQDEYAKATVKNKESLKAINAESRQYSSELQNNIKSNNSAKDSLTQLKASVSNLTKQYESLSAQQRKGAEGKGLVEQINNQKKAIKEGNESIGNYRDSVGGYENAINSAMKGNMGFVSSLGGIGAAGEGFKSSISAMGNVMSGLGKSLLALITNPIVAVLAAIVLSIKAIGAAIKSSDELSDRWSVTMSKLKRVFDFLMLVIQKVVGVLMDYIDVMMKGFDFVMNLLSKLPGKVGETIKQMEAATTKAEEMAKRAVKLEDDMRAAKVTNAKTEMEIAELRAKAADKEKYTGAQRYSFLMQALTLEKQMMNSKLKIAKEDFDIAKEQASRNQTSEEALDNLAEKEAALYNIRKESSDFNRSVQKQKKTALADLREESEEMRKYKEMLAGLDEAVKNASKIEPNKKLTDFTNELFGDNNLEGVGSKMQQDRLKSIQDRYDSEIQSITDNETLKNTVIQEQAQAQIDAINEMDAENQINTFGSIEAATQAVRDAEEKKKSAIRSTADIQKQVNQELLGASATMFGTMSQFLTEFGGQNQALGALAKGLALMEIGLNTAKAISGAIASAQSVPFPGNLIAIASGVTAVLSAMIQAKQVLQSSKEPENKVSTVKKPKFHTGGLVGGTGEVDATLLSGETVMTTSATSAFSGALSAMEAAASGNRVVLNNYQNSQGMEFFKEAFAAALREMPTPVVSVDEFNRVANRIKIADRISKT